MIEASDHLALLAHFMGLRAYDLYDAIYECVSAIHQGELNEIEDEDEQEQRIDAWGDEAADINNAGLEAQVVFLLEHNSADEVEALLRQALADRKAAT